jgi:hypothetical protein
MKKRKINVLGTIYKIHTDVTPTQDPRIEYVDGFCDTTTKDIKIKVFTPSENSVADLDGYRRKVLRHELVHAYMYESGLDINSEWGRDETLIDWIAIQHPKMAATFEKAERNVLGTDKK